MADEPGAERMGGAMARGALWMTGSTVVTKGASLIARLLVLAGLLGPEEMGIFGIAAAVLVLIEMTSQIGVQQALIQRRDGVDALLGTAWSLQAARGAILAVLIAGTSGPVAAYFEAPRSRDLLLSLAVVPLILGCRNAAMATLHRRLRFGAVFAYEVGAVVFEAVVSIAWALYDPSAWALVVGRVAGAAYQLIASFLLVDQRSRPSFSASACRQILGFGGWVTASTLLSVILVRGGDLVIAKLLPVAVLGVYQLAFQLTNVPICDLGRSLNSVLFPALSRMQDDRMRLADAFRRATALQLVAYGAIGCVTLAAIDPLLDSVLDPRWAGIAELAPWLVAVAVCRAIGSGTGALFQAVGRPALMAGFQLAMVLAFGALILPAARAGGAVGVAALAAWIGIAATAVRLWWIHRMLAIPLLGFAAALALPGFAATLGVVAAGAIPPTGSGLLDLALALVSSAACYAAIMLAWLQRSPGGVLGQARALVSTVRGTSC